jgi:DNA-binding transcriptional LysR family regulator
MDRLDLRLVEYFIAVAEELHFGRAAERLHIAQPSLSQQIRRLEQQLGVRLLDRNSRRVELTAAGEALLREGRKTLRQAQNAVRTVQAAALPMLVVGLYGSAGIDLLPAVLRAFSDRHPACTVSVRELRLGDLRDLLSGQVEVAFTRLLPGQAELDVEVLTREPRVAALPVSHRLAGRQSLTFAELSEESFITNPAEPAEGDRPARWLNEQRRHGLQGRVSATAGGVVELLTLVAAGRGVCLVPSTVARHYPRADVCYLPVTDADPAVVSLAWRPGDLTAAASSFVDVAREVSGDPLSEPGSWPVDR